ncbi:MmcQ/YjbR family DNA-binding protein [Lacihabitans sp. LS3-19]|uniref:MmcQ/YjbR family DNA-binding protein n=1 Tax=Lacihabitans sp. LS3-19 TaxID=2487335 RepID=UPI0020CFB994|nr:MmcQ/YjbR family DNA-binding protein [Lacihabitans sp. LS3-19]MCP9770029.1 MmcQ/YjbR family DNA-binding protein [Lacihabitans sp. LS3-19]
MTSISDFRKLAMALPQAEEAPHFDKSSFRIKKKIFATINEKENRATLKFSPEEQGIFSKINPDSIFSVPNKWGKMGWTHLHYLDLSQEIIEGLLKAAYCSVAPKNLAELVISEDL